MGKSCFDYQGYRTQWLCKSDLTPKFLKRYGIKASVKEIKTECVNAIDGSITIGGMGHQKHIYTYSIPLLIKTFKK